MNSPPRCPQCGSKRLYRAGLRYLKDGSTVQRWLCRCCGYRFTNPDSKRSFNCSDTFQHVENVQRLNLKTADDLPYGCQVGAALARGAKNLVELETRQEKAQREGTAEKAEIKGKIIEFIWNLKKNGYSPSTMKVYSRWLSLLIKNGANLNDPETVKETVALHENWSITTKSNVILAYKAFANFARLKWTPPKYKHSQKLPFIPLESEIDTLVSGAGPKTAIRLQLLKETGMRIGEAARLHWTDIDFKRSTITVNNPEKNSNPRIFKVSSKLMNMLNNMSKDDKKVFSSNLKGWRASFAITRKRLAAKLQNPRLLQIHFHTLRHWKATMEYHKTKNIYHVKNLLGHKLIQNTERYITLENAIFDESYDEYHSATARTVEEAKKLLEVGFEYVCTYNDTMLFKKRK